MSAVLALLAVAVGKENLLVREFHLAHDSRRIELSVHDDYDADFAVLVVTQLLASILERGASCILTDLQIAVSFDRDFAILFASLIVCTAKRMQSLLQMSFFLFCLLYVILCFCYFVVVAVFTHYL